MYRRERTSYVPPIEYAIAKGEKKRRGSILREIDQGFGEADLSEHLIARDRPFPRCIEENVSLLLSVLVIVGNGAARLERRVVDG
jgi:hypothetical protein